MTTGVAFRKLHNRYTRDATRHIITDPPTIAAAFACTVTIESAPLRSLLCSDAGSALSVNRSYPYLSHARFIAQKIHVISCHFVHVISCHFVLTRRFLSPISNAGNWLSSSRRWLNPRKPQDHAQLRQNFDKLCDAFLPIAARCEIATFLQTFHEISGTWVIFLPNQDTGPGIYRPPQAPKQTPVLLPISVN